MQQTPPDRPLDVVRRCQELTAWLRSRGYEASEWRVLKSAPADRVVYRLIPPAGQSPVILKHKGQSGAPVAPAVRIPPEIRLLYPEVLMNCDACALHVECEVDGIRLDRVERSRRERAFFRAGIAVATLHATRPPSRPPASVDRLIEQIVVFAQQLRASGLDLEPLPALAQLRGHLCKQHGELPRVWIHGDLKPSHVYLSAHRCQFIDMDRLHVGLAIEDVASLLVHQEWLDPQDRVAAAAFARGYATVLPFPTEKLLAIARLHAILRTIRNRTVCEPTVSCSRANQALGHAWQRLSEYPPDAAQGSIPLPGKRVSRLYFPKPGRILGVRSGARYLRWSARKAKWSRREAATDPRLAIPRQVLEPLFWSEAWGTEVRRLQCLRYKPESRLSLRAFLPGTRDRIIKIYSPGSFARKLTGFRWWQQAALQTAPADHQWATIVDLSEELRTVVMEAAPGVALSGERHSEDLLSRVARLAQQLREHARAGDAQQTRARASGVPLVGCSQMLQQVCQWICRMDRAAFWPSEALAPLWTALEEGRCVPDGEYSYQISHGDFVPGNLMLDRPGGTLHLLDPDHLCLAPAGYDAAAYAASLLFGGMIRDDAVTRFLRVSRGPESDPRSLRLMLGLWIIRLALAELCQNRFGEPAHTVTIAALDAIQHIERIRDEDLHSLA